LAIGSLSERERAGCKKKRKTATVWRSVANPRLKWVVAAISGPQRNLSSFCSV